MPAAARILRSCSVGQRVCARYSSRARGPGPVLGWNFTTYAHSPPFPSIIDLETFRVCFLTLRIHVALRSLPVPVLGYNTKLQCRPYYGTGVVNGSYVL